MALFSRRKKHDPSEPVATAAEPLDAADAPGEEPIGTEADAAASVGISVSAYQGLGAQAPADAPSLPALADAPEGPQTPAPRRRTLGPAVAPPSTETVPGLRDNVVLREALAGLPAPAGASDLLEVARQLLQGHLFLRVKGDARALLSEGRDLPLGVASVNGTPFVLAYSSGTALRQSIQADGQTDTSAMGQPVLAVIRYVLAGSYGGLIIDNSSAPARAVLPRELLQKLLDQADPSLEVKTLLAGERTHATASAVAEALTRVRFWVAVNRSPEGRFGVAEARTQEGARLIELYSHPLEVASQQRGDQTAPMTGAQLASALRADEGIAGAIVDPGGPWIRLSRDDLAPLLALPA